MTVKCRGEVLLLISLRVAWGWCDNRGTEPGNAWISDLGKWLSWFNTRPVGVFTNIQNWHQRLYYMKWSKNLWCQYWHCCQFRLFCENPESWYSVGLKFVDQELLCYKLFIVSDFYLQIKTRKKLSYVKSILTVRYALRDDECHWIYSFLMVWHYSRFRSSMANQRKLKLP